MPCHAWQPAPSPWCSYCMQVINDEKPNIQTGLTCPVKDCVSVCDLVVMQVGRMAVVAPGLCGHSLHSCEAWQGWDGLPGSELKDLLLH